VAKQGAPARRDRAGRGQSSDARFDRNVVHLIELGPRVVAEFLAEIGHDYLLRLVIEELLHRCVTQLTPVMLRVVGGDRFAPAPIRLIAARGRAP
jgi:hypothetical protein